MFILDSKSRSRLWFFRPLGPWSSSMGNSSMGNDEISLTTEMIALVVLIEKLKMALWH